MSAAVEQVIERVRQVYGSWKRDTPVAQMRQDWDTLFGGAAVNASIEDVDAGGVKAQWVSAPGADPRHGVLYLHGGGFQVGSLVSHRELMAGLSAASNCRVLGVDYRLAPEHRYPAALDDAWVAWQWLADQGFEAQHVALAGDSAGGGLVLSLLLRLRDAGQPLPAAAVLMSAWTDLTASGASYGTRADSDPIHQRPMIVAMARNYLGKEGNPADPLVSPMFAELRGLPPLLAQVGDRETVLDDSRDFVARAREAGVDATLQVWDHMIHVFQQFPAQLPEARAAIDELGRFLRRHLPA
ncbi:alpha/beta hydrolase [Hydrogenophaga laconesensis]|uniref:Acetyl esterase/lipase n=1 Tax=Hydrogenophaga laconesensis TaxID=1805971 RepID=A0ABU1V6M8_9BURK|nr:alpha/beta hydrolase [Hydrogenophaga laconesensis]MDR7093117.1 acetyl esterase/lipase [Hydrogenophaga laconesensis]